MRPERGRREVAATWEGQVVAEKASLESLLDSCHENIKDAAIEEAYYRAEFARLPAGHPLIVGTKDEEPLAVKIRIAVADRAHWREYVSYYSARVAKEGGATMITIRPPKSEERRPARQPRERVPGQEG